MSGWRALGISITIALASISLSTSRGAAEETASAQSQPSAAAHEATEQQSKPSLAGPKMKNGERAGMRMRPNRLGRGPLGVGPDLGGDEPAGMSDPFLTNEQIDRLMSFMQTNFPVMHDRLARMRQRDPALFQKRIHQTARVLFPMVRAASENPELARKMVAEHQAQLALQELKEKYSKAREPAEQAKIREEMRQQMDVAFEARIERIRIEVKQLQKRLDRATQDLANQERDKEKLISSRLSDMISSAGSTP
jgi:hypothetical protein